MNSEGRGFAAAVVPAERRAGLRGRPCVRADRAAVDAALTLDYNSGAVEGNVTRIKAIKRQVYGRCGFDLLCKRIPHRTWPIHLRTPDRRRGI